MQLVPTSATVAVVERELLRRRGLPETSRLAVYEEAMDPSLRTFRQPNAEVVVRLKGTEKLANINAKSGDVFIVQLVSKEPGETVETFIERKINECKGEGAAAVPARKGAVVGSGSCIDRRSGRCVALLRALTAASSAVARSDVPAPGGLEGKRGPAGHDDDRHVPADCGAAGTAPGPRVLGVRPTLPAAPVDAESLAEPRGQRGDQGEPGAWGGTWTGTPGRGADSRGDARHSPGPYQACMFRSHRLGQFFLFLTRPSHR